MNRVLKFLTIVGLGLPGLSLLPAKGQGVEPDQTPSEFQVQGLPNENFNFAAAQMWLPPESQEVQSILCIVLHPLGQRGARLEKPGPWIALAERCHSALLVVSFAESDRYEGRWCKAEEGSGAALTKIINASAQESGHAEISRVPLVMIGVCAAGQFAFHFAATEAGRIGAFVTIGGGKHNLAAAAGAARVPALLVTATDREELGTKNLENLYVEGRKRGAPWKLVSNLMAAYDGGKCSHAVLEYVEAALLRCDFAGQDPTKPQHDQLDLMTGYEETSLCGVKLPVYGNLTPARLELGRIDIADSKSVHASFQIHLDQSVADDANIPITEIVKSRRLVKADPDTVLVDCELDLSTNTLGTLHRQIPVCYSRNKRPVLGGSMLEVFGTIDGELTVAPQSIRLAENRDGRVESRSIKITSKGNQSLKVISCSTTADWIAAEAVPCTDGSSEVRVNYLPTAESQDLLAVVALKIQIADVCREVRVTCFRPNPR